jgi:hypothetical protein
LPYSHKRSSKKYAERKQKQEEFNLRNQQAATVRKYVYQTSFRDRIIKEIVCTQTPSLLDEFLKSTLTVDQPQMYFPMNESYVDGLVLVNQLSYEFTVNAPHLSRVSDLEDLHPVEKYQDHAITYSQPRVTYVGKEIRNLYGDESTLEKPVQISH